MTLGIRFVVLIIGIVLASVQCQTSVRKAEATKDDGAKQTDGKKQRPKDETLVPRGFDFANAPEIIAFGSNLNQNKPQPIWDVIFKSNPDLFILAGNTINTAQPESKPISAQYKKLDLIPEFRHFRELVPMMATWDENDFGVKIGVVENADKDDARREFLYQWSYVKDSLKVNQKGIYHAKILGGVRKKSSTFQVILLDTRSFKSALKKVDDPGAAGTTKVFLNDDKKATVLGNDQWEWLERQLRKPADIRIVVSSIPLISDETATDGWAGFPREKDRFFELIRRTQAHNLFIVSGGRNWAVAKKEIKGWGTLYDFTSGGLTATDSSELAKGPSADPIKAENFGLLSVDWSRKKMEIQIRDAANGILNKAEIKIR